MNDPLYWTDPKEDWHPPRRIPIESQFQNAMDKPPVRSAPNDEKAVNRERVIRALLKL